MINWQSILSSFDDKPTLLEWLKKAQKALNESVLTTVMVTQEKAGRVNSITLSFNFQDGTKIVAPAFTVQDGKDGTGITDLIDTNLTEKVEYVSYDTTKGLYLASIQRLTYLNGKHTSTLEFRLPIMPGSGINIDKRENTNEIEIKVDASGFKSIFGNQTVVGNGNIDLYQHNIEFKATNIETTIRLIVVSSKNVIVDSLTDLKTLLGNTFTYPCSGADNNGRAIVFVKDNGYSTVSDIVKDEFTYYPAGAWTDTVTTI